MMEQTIDLSFLSPDEYRKIIDVIKRDQDLKKQEEHRVFHLKAEIQRLRKRGIIKQGSLDSTRCCARCLAELGRIINRGAQCSLCRKKVCKTCRHYSDDGLQWVCVVCHKQTQLKAITGEWMLEYARKAGKTSATSVPICSTSYSAVKSLTKGIIPSRLPPIDPLLQNSPPPRTPPPKSPLSAKSSTDRDSESPKLPPSPVLKALQSTAELCSSGQNSRSGSPSQQTKQTVFRKVSNRMLDSSSSDEEPEQEMEFAKESLHKTNSSGSTPSPRTPNSCKILSLIAQNQATAFAFPPIIPSTSSHSSRPSSQEKQSQSERQSSDEFSTTMSSLRSISTSSELFDDNFSDPKLTPQPLPRSRRVSPLRKQSAIAEEAAHESLRSSLEAEYGSCPSSATTSAPDSGVADCNYASPPKNFFNSSDMKRSTSGHDDSFILDCVPARESVSSLSEGEAVIEKTTGYVFRKVTIKKRNSSSSTASSSTIASTITDQKHNIEANVSNQKYINQSDRKVKEKPSAASTATATEEVTERRITPPYTRFHTNMATLNDNTSEQWIDDSEKLLDTDIEISKYSSDTDDYECGNLSDSASSSSEEGLFSTPTTHYTPQQQQVYGNPLAYSLHTIAEESCEESESIESTRPSTPNCEQSAEYDKYSNYQISHNDHHKHDSWCVSEAESIDSMSEASEPATNADFNDIDNEVDVDAIHLASSRLETYFTSGLLGSGAFTYPDDVEFAEESDYDSRLSSLESKYRNNDNIDNNLKNAVTSDSVIYDSEINELNKFKENEIKCLATEQNNNAVCDDTKPKIDETVVSESHLSRESDNQILSDNKDAVQASCDSNDNEIIANKVRFDDDVTTFMNKLLSQMSNFNNFVPNDDENKAMNNSNLNECWSDNKPSMSLPSLKALEYQIASGIANLMKAVSPEIVSPSDNSSTYTSSSTIGSNNSDYGSDTLESGEYSSNDEQEGRDDISNLENKRKKVARRESNRSVTNSGNSSDSTVSEETAYICKQLMSSLKKLTEIAFNDNCKDNESDITKDVSDVTKARMYIRDQIVALMHTVQSSSNNSPVRERRDRKSSQTPFQHNTNNDSDCNSSDCGDSSPKIGCIGKTKTPSESGSETTCSASVSIPSYDDSDHTPTESEISHEMEELFALRDGSNKDNSNECNIINIRPSLSSDEDRASLNSWEARISLFAKVQANDEIRDNENNKCLETHDLPEVHRTVTPNIKSQEITINGKEIKHKCGDEENSHRNSRNNNLQTMPTGHKTVVKIDDINRTDSLSPLFDSLKDRSFSSDSVSSVQTVKARLGNIATASMSEISSDGTQSTSRLAIDEDDEVEADTNLSNGGALRKSFNAKEKASSENNLVANLIPSTAKTNAITAKSAGNISELDSCNKSTFRDTGYYSFKSSEESIKSLDESVNSSVTNTANITSASVTNNALNMLRVCSVSTLPHVRQPKSETIVEVDEECDFAKMQPSKRLFTPSYHSQSSHCGAKAHSYSSPNIPEDVFTARSTSLPLNTRNKIILQHSSIPHRTRSSFFSTSGVLRKLTALRGDENTFRASPRRLRDRTRASSGGNDSEIARAKHSAASGAAVPQISVSDYSESFSNRGSVASSTGESSERQEEDIEHVFAYHSRSQTSLSSFGARSESMSSVYSAAGGGRYGAVTVTGEVLFCISYNYKAGAMEVYIRECRNLAPVDTKRNRSDPYVKVYLLPDRTKSGKRKTKVKKHTLNPVFEEILKFYMTISEVETRTLWLSVWHSDIFGRNDFLGEVTLPLGHEVFETPGLKWFPLQERLEVADNTLNYKGDIFLALKYTSPDVTSRRHRKSGSTTKGELQVLVKEAHNLTATRSNGTSDPFCKSYLLPDKSKSGKQKTPVIKKTCNPKWNHTFVYEDVTINDLRERCLELTIWDYDKITSNDFLGGVRLCLGFGKHEGRIVDWMDSVGDEITLWQQMLDRPNMWVYGELHLRSSMQTRRS